MTDSNKNMGLWNSVCVTDPKKVKPITGKDYKGSSPQPYWLVQRATEVFGPCGQCWGIEVKSQGFERFDEFTIMHWALVAFWYIQDGKKCVTEHMGGTKAMYKTSNGSKKYDEDAPKKSVTDAVVKAMSYLGFAGDIFGGLWDDSKYIEYANDYHHSDNRSNNSGGQQASKQQNSSAQQNNQQPDHQDLESRYQNALVSVRNAKKSETLDKALKTFEGTKFYTKISQACQARADQMGWMNQNQRIESYQNQQYQH